MSIRHSFYLDEGLYLDISKWFILYCILRKRGICLGQIYFLGTFEDNLVLQPFEFGGSWHRTLIPLLEKSNINIFDDFHFCITTGDVHDPLFYKITDKNRYLLDLKEEMKLESEPVWQEDIHLGETTFPLVCDGVERKGTSYHIIQGKIKKPNYTHIIPLEVNMAFLKKEYPQREEWFLQNILDYYQAILSWVKENKKIYYYRYY